MFDFDFTSSVVQQYSPCFPIRIRIIVTSSHLSFDHRSADQRAREEKEEETNGPEHVENADSVAESSTHDENRKKEEKDEDLSGVEPRNGILTSKSVRLRLIMEEMRDER